ncbi:hypothetical protein BKA62DRAFT_682826 [Auriculariales sp. MPI-PUGE-AT-0066]|nr:hypothetical protein BKA62DRAFT_682826 [Auriculariales sp. MPI-PUGE-AT-0066]
MKRPTTAPPRLVIDSNDTMNQPNNTAQPPSLNLAPVTPLDLSAAHRKLANTAALRQSQHPARPSGSRVWRWVCEQKLLLSSCVSQPDTDTLSLPPEPASSLPTSTPSVYSGEEDEGDANDDWMLPPGLNLPFDIRSAATSGIASTQIDFVDRGSSEEARSQPGLTDARPPSSALGTVASEPITSNDIDPVDPVLPLGWAQSESKRVPLCWTHRRPSTLSPPRDNHDQLQLPTGSLIDAAHSIPAFVTPRVWQASRITGCEHEVPPVPPIPERFLASKALSGTGLAPPFHLRTRASSQPRPSRLRPISAPGERSMLAQTRVNSARPQSTVEDTQSGDYFESAPVAPLNVRKRSNDYPSFLDSAQSSTMSSLAPSWQLSDAPAASLSYYLQPMLLRAPASAEAGSLATFNTGSPAYAPIHARFARSSVGSPPQLYPVRSSTTPLYLNTGLSSRADMNGDFAASNRFLASGHSTPYSTRSRSPVPTVGRSAVDNLSVVSRSSSPVLEIAPRGLASSYRSASPLPIQESRSAGTQAQASASSRHRDLTLPLEGIASLVRVRAATSSSAHPARTVGVEYNDFDASSTFDLEPPRPPFARGDSRRNSSSSSIESSNGLTSSSKSSLESGIGFERSSLDSSSNRSKQSTTPFSSFISSSAPSTPIGRDPDGSRMLGHPFAISQKDKRASACRTSILVPTMVSAPLQTLPASLYPSSASHRAVSPTHEREAVDRARSPTGSPLRAATVPAPGMGFAAPRRASLIPIAKPLIEPPSLAALSSQPSSPIRPRGRDATPRGRATDLAPTSFGLDKLLGMGRRHSVSKDRISAPMPVEVGEVILQDREVRREEAKARPRHKRFRTEPSSRNRTHSSSSRPPSLDPTLTPSESTMNLHEHLLPTQPIESPVESGTDSPASPTTPGTGTSSPATPIRSHPNPYALKSKPSDGDIRGRTVKYQSAPTSPDASSSNFGFSQSQLPRSSSQRKSNKLVRRHSRSRSHQRSTGSDSDNEELHSPKQKKVKGVVPPSAFRGEDIPTAAPAHPDNSSISSFGLVGDPFKRLPDTPTEPDIDPTRPESLSRRQDHPSSRNASAIDNEKTPTNTPMRADFDAHAQEVELLPRSDPRAPIEFRSLPSRRGRASATADAHDTLQTRGRPSTSSSGTSESVIFSPVSAHSGRPSTATSESSHKQSELTVNGRSNAGADKKTSPYTTFAPPPSSFNKAAVSEDTAGGLQRIRKALSFTSLRGSTSASSQLGAPGNSQRLTKSAHGHAATGGAQDASDDSDFELIEAPRDAAYRYAQSASASTAASTHSLGSHSVSSAISLSTLVPRLRSHDRSGRSRGTEPREPMAVDGRERTDSILTSKSAKPGRERVIVKASPCPPALAVQMWAQKYGPVSRLQTKNSGVLVEWRAVGVVASILGAGGDDATLRKEVDLQMRGAGRVKIARA